MKIFDCFQFFDEDMMLDLRLNILDRYVDKFVIVENLFMHSGKKKKQVFNINNYKKFQSKIEYILIDKLPEGLQDVTVKPNKSSNPVINNTLLIEHNQRNSILKGLNDASQNDLILISDVDEIPNLERFNYKLNKKLIFFKQQMYYYKFNLKYGNKEWIGTKGCLKKDLISPQWLRDIKGRSYPFWRLDILFSKMKYNSIEYVENGGWHFTNLRTAEELKKKLENFGHNAEFLESGLNVNDITKMMENNLAVYDYEADMKGNKWSGKPLIKTETKELPQYILLNKEKYTDWFS